MAIIVSTVGDILDRNGNEPSDKFDKDIGLDRQYETMIFGAIKDGEYWHINTDDEICGDYKWRIEKVDHEKGTDNEADDMHEMAVIWATDYIRTKNDHSNI